MGNGAETRSYGRVFDEIADAYGRHRPAYPDALVDRACELAGLRPGAAVLEIGCGTGQLTRSLLERGLRVTAVEPGAQLVARARDQLAGAGDVQFLNARLEDARLPRARYRAVFSASAIHWVDPDVGWRAIADALVDGGTVALLSVLRVAGLAQHRGSAGAALSAGARRARARRRMADLPRSRCDAGGRRGATAQPVGGVGWLGSHEVAREYVAGLFRDAEIATIPILVQHTADALNELLGTMSFWARLTPGQREALIAENHALHQRLGRPIRSSTVACLVTARRAGRP